MKEFKVGDQYRTNPLSLKPGGYEVTVVYQDGKRFVYDKVKKPGWYVKSIETQGKNKSHGPVTEVYVDKAKVWDHTEVGRNPWDIQND